MLLKLAKDRGDTGIAVGLDHKQITPYGGPDTLYICGTEHGIWCINRIHRAMPRGLEVIRALAGS